MALTDYTVKGVPADMTEAALLAVLRAAQSPVRDEDARKVYAYAVGRKLSPAFLLAMMHHESNYGRLGSAATTHSWGNTRPPSFGAPQTGVSDRNFSIYANWVDGGVSTVARLFDHLPYQGKDTVREIIPIWAPSTDGNVPERYIAAVLADIEKWTGGTVVVGNPLAKLTDVQGFLPKTAVNNPNRIMTGGSPNWITVHETGNLNPGATAQMHYTFVMNGGGEHRVSFHATVDEFKSFQMMPWNAVAWHAGDGAGGTGNNDSIAIETVQIGNFRRTVANLAALVARLMDEFSIPIERVVQHNKWSGKNCPQYLRAGTLPNGGAGITWNNFIAMVQREYNDLSRAPLEGEVREPAEGEFTAYQNAKGQTIFVWNAGGEAVRTDGIAALDLGVSVENAAGEKYDRSIQDNVVQQWQGPR